MRKVLEIFLVGVFASVVGGLLLFVILDNFSKDKEENVLDEPIIYSKDLIKIQKFEPRREVYYVGEAGKADIILDNPRELNYTLSVYLSNEYQRNLIWSTNNNTNNIWETYGNLNNEGLWTLDLVVNWTDKGYSFDTGKSVDVIVYPSRESEIEPGIKQDTTYLSLLTLLTSSLSITSPVFLSHLSQK